MSKALGFRTKVLKLKGISRAIIIGTALIASLIIFVTIYASQVGNFVISASNGELELYLSETIDFENYESVLTAPTVSQMDNTTLSHIDVDLIKTKDGSANSRTYLAYNFYLRNYSSRMVGYNVRLLIDEVYKKVDEAMWVLVIEKKDETESKNIYAKRQTSGENKGEPENCLGFEATPFLSNTTIFDYDVQSLRSGEIVKYTIIIWLEGNDRECIDTIKEGSIRITLKFAAF